MTTQPATPKTSKPRVIRTPAQKAQDLLDQAKARGARAHDAAARAEMALRDAKKAADAAHAEESAAESAVEFYSNHPDLPKGNQSTITQVVTSDEAVKGVSS